jgi:HD-like signal output (HDOD) protein
MLVRLILLLVVAALIAVAVRSLLKRSTPPPRPVPPPPPPQAAAPATAPAALPAPTSDATPALTAEQALHELNELAFGRELGTPASQHTEIMEAAENALQTAATEPKYAPRRPMLLPQLLRAVSDTDTSRRELSTMIAKDPSLVGSLLKLANSQYYRASAQPVESVDRAVAVIGTEGIRSLIAAAVVQPVFQIAGGTFAQFPEVVWDHTFLAANAAETYAAVVVNSDPFAAQLLALVNGLGTIVVFRVALDQYSTRPGAIPDAATIVALMEAHTARVARTIAASWDLSGRILAAFEDQIPGAMVESPTALGRALRFGRYMGALAVLNTRGIVDDDAAKASMLANNAAGAHFERMWERLTGKKPAQPPKPAPSVSNWRR